MANASGECITVLDLFSLAFPNQAAIMTGLGGNVSMWQTNVLWAGPRLIDSFFNELIV